MPLKNLGGRILGITFRTKIVILLIGLEGSGVVGFVALAQQTQRTPRCQAFQYTLSNVLSVETTTAAGIAVGRFARGADIQSVVSAWNPVVLSVVPPAIRFTTATRAK